MKYVKLGNAGMEVSRLCLGCMDFAVRLPEKEALGVIDTALEQGINFLDTADMYGNGEGEKFLGRVLQGRREQVIIATKFFNRMYDRPNGMGCSRVHLMNAVEDSLRRLQTDYIDLYQLHHPDVNTPIEETLATLDTLVQQGKVRYIGVSNHYAWQMAHMLGVSALHNWEPLVSVQCQYNILDRAVENEIVPFCQRFNIAMMLYGPLCGGILTGKYRRGQPLPEDSRAAKWDPDFQIFLMDEVFNIIEELEQIAGRYDVKINQLAIAWLLSKPYVTTPIMGGSKPEHFTQIYEAMDVQIDEADLRRIDEISEAYRYRPFFNQPHSAGARVALNRW